MEIITSTIGSAEEASLMDKMDALRTLEPDVDAFMQFHLQKRRLWFSSDFLPADEKAVDPENDTFYNRLRERARSLGDAARVSLIVNLLTEEGLPHFHRIISTHLGDESVWGRWNNIWTAEEDRHGAILRDYMRDSRIVNWHVVEYMQYAYQEAGFNPEWDKDPYRVFVYTSLQERATQYAHRNTARYVGEDEPVFQNIAKNIAADEAKHFQFYRNVFKKILEMDPNRALQSALAIMPSIDMPGYRMPNFKEMADVIRRVGIYTPWDYKEIVEEAMSFWKIEHLTGLSEAGRKAQEKIMAIPKRLQQIAEYIERRTVSKTFSFDFIYGRLIAFQ
ncbi:MAG: acyl-ACP desaturase [Bacteroidetes Order II. Incertae sedis bacterium]|nr:acyl-ACP desaturase [Bacteroidetes Order II. bacterium]